MHSRLYSMAVDDGNDDNDNYSESVLEWSVLYVRVFVLLNYKLMSIHCILYNRIGIRKQANTTKAFHIGYFRIPYSAPHQKPQKPLNECTRLVLGLRKYARLGSSHGLLLNCTLMQYIDKAICIMLFKIIRDGSPDYLFNRLTFARSTRTQMIRTPYRRLSSIDGMFFVKGIAPGNRLPLILRQSTSICEFKRMYDLYLNHQ